MATPKLVTVSLRNEPGTLAELVRTIAKERINIEAIESESIGDFGYARIASSNPEKLEKALKANGYDPITTELLEVTLPNEAGMLAPILERLAESDVNIVSLIGTTTPEAGDGRLFLQVSDPVAARKVLGSAAARPPMAR